LYILEEFGSNKYEPLGTYICSLTSDITGLGSTNQKDIEVSIHPNPVESIVNISFDPPGNGKLKIQLYDIHGQKLIEQIETVGSNGPYQTSLQLDHLHFGVYYLKFEFMNSDQYYFVGRKIIKQ